MLHVSNTAPWVARFYTQVTRRMRDATLVTTPGQLDAAVFRLQGASRLAVDTEFMRERTYRAQLCLVQVASDADCYLIDPLAGLDLAPLFAVLADRGKLKILHAARQDLEVLLQSGGSVPAPVFDTQVAAALLGLPPQAGYAELVARRLGHSIDKGQTRTDWSRRPLSPAQLAYAADDVHHLLHLHSELAAELEARGRATWHAEECVALESPALYRTEPCDAWRRFKGLGRLRPQEQCVVRTLAAWREERAIASDKPRGWILADEAVLALATLAPATMAELEQVRALPPGVAHKRGEELLELMRTAREATDAAAPWQVPPRPTPEQTRLVGQLQQRVRDVAASLEVSPELIATRRDVEAMVFGKPQESLLLRGWRCEVIGGQLLELTGG
jgi:ribonuclease D